MRIFCGRGDQSNSAVLDVLKKSLLLLSVEILYLVDIEKYAPCAENIVGAVQNILDVGKRRGSGIEPVKDHSRFPRDYFGGGGLSRAGRSKEYHIGYSSRRENSANYSAGTEKMLLTDYIVYCLGAEKLRRSYNSCHFLSFEESDQIVDEFRDVGESDKRDNHHYRKDNDTDDRADPGCSLFVELYISGITKLLGNVEMIEIGVGYVFCDRWLSIWQSL